MESVFVGLHVHWVSLCCSSGMFYSEWRAAWKGSGSTEVSWVRSWWGASKALKPAGNALWGNTGPLHVAQCVYIYPVSAQEGEVRRVFKRLTLHGPYKILTTKQELNMNKKRFVVQEIVFLKSGGYSLSLQCLFSVLNLSKSKAKIFTVLTLMINSTMSTVFFWLFISCLFWIVLQIFAWRA